MRVVVIVLEGVFDLGLSSFCDALAVANAQASGQSPFLVTRVGVRRRVRTCQKLAVPVETPPARAPDVVLVPGFVTHDPVALDHILRRADVRDAQALLSEWSGSGTILGAACTGTFVLAAAGLLDRRQATTTSWLAAAFRKRFPAVNLDASRLLVDDGGVITAGAALSHLDLALWIIRGVSPSLARSVARYLAFDTCASHMAFALPTQRVAYGDALVERFEEWTRGHLASFSVERAARALGASARTLERRVQNAMGRSPVSYLRDLRAAEAVRQLETGERGIDEIATDVGYASGATLRTLLRKRTGLGIRALRRRAR